MSAASAREKNMLVVLGVLALYAFAALCFKKQAANWKTARNVYANACRKYREENALIAARREWSERYGRMRGLMPVFPYEKDVDTHWLNVMDSAAQRHDLTITRRQTSREEEVGDVYELPIDCKDWEGTLESLVKFLYDLNGEGAMLDVRQLYIRPSPRAGYLKGTFTLYCAYMRGDEARPAAAPNAPAATNATTNAAATGAAAPAGTNAAATAANAATNAATTAPALAAGTNAAPAGKPAAAPAPAPVAAPAPAAKKN